MNLKIDKNTL